MVDSIPIQGKGKEVVVGVPGEGNETDSSEEEEFWKWERVGDREYKRSEAGGPVLLKDSPTSDSIVTGVIERLQFSGDHQELNRQPISQVAADACRTLMKAVLPRLRNIERRGEVYAERKAKYKKLLRVADPGAMQEEYNIMSARLESLETDHEKVKKTLAEQDDAYLKLNGRHKTVKFERNKLRDANKDLTQQLYEREQELELAKKEIADLKEKYEGQEARVAWDALLKFTHSKAFNFAANLHCYDNAERFFWKSVGQLVKLGMVPPETRKDDRLRMDLDENLDPMAEGGNPEDNLTEPEYSDLVALLQNEFMAAHPLEDDAEEDVPEGPQEDIQDITGHSNAQGDEVGAQNEGGSARDDGGGAQELPSQVLAPTPLSTAPPEPSNQAQ